MSATTVTTKSPGAVGIATGQVSIDTTSGGVLVCAARTMQGVSGGRRRIKITNHGTTACYVGNSGLTTGTGFLLAGIVGYTVTLDTTAAVYGISAGTQTVSYVEEYDQ